HGVRGVVSHQRRELQRQQQLRRGSGRRQRGAARAGDRRRRRERRLPLRRHRIPDADVAGLELLGRRGVPAVTDRSTDVWRTTKGAQTSVMPITLDDLRRFAVARSLFTPTTLKRALHRLGFVQADPIRAPARAQDLTLRHRVNDYHAGDLERRYATLGVEEDVFVSYGFVTRSIHALMHPRPETRVPAEGRGAWPAARRKQAKLVLEFVRERGAVHPREVDD